MRLIVCIVQILVMASCFNSTCFAATLYEDNFDGYTDSPTLHGWNFGGQVGVTDSGRTGRGVVINYTSEGTAQYIFSRDISFREAWYEFSFKRVGWANCGGFKFIKLRAINTDSNYANLTTQTNYTNGDIQQVDHGCGADDAGDQGCGGFFSSATTWNSNGTVVTPHDPYTFPDENWHTYLLYVKLNSDGVADGAYTVKIDGVTYREVIDVVIRADSNPTVFTDLLLGDYGGYIGCPPYSYDIFYDDIKIYNSDPTTPSFSGSGFTIQ